MANRQSTDTLQKSSFLFSISDGDLKELEFFCSGISGLGISLGAISQEWQSLTTNRPGDSLTWNELSLTAILDEDFTVFDEIFAFIQKIKDQSSNAIDWNKSFTGVLYITNNKNKRIKKFTLYDCWISSLGDLDFSTDSTDSDIHAVSINVVYDYYTLESIE